MLQTYADQVALYKIKSNIDLSKFQSYGSYLRHISGEYKKGPLHLNLLWVIDYDAYVLYYNYTRIVKLRSKFKMYLARCRYTTISADIMEWAKTNGVDLYNVTPEDRLVIDLLYPKRKPIELEEFDD